VSARTRKVVVVGNGMAGFRFVQELAQLAPGLDITVVGDEPGGAYNRARLPLLLDGVVRADSIALSDEGWYERHRVRLVTASARRIDRTANRVETASGDALPYDVLVLAVGAAPVLPRADGLASWARVAGTGGLGGPDGALPHSALPYGAVAFRTLADTAAIKSIATAARQAVVLGGGGLGLETAAGLAAGGLAVTLVQRSPRLMERQLDAGAARVLARSARALGVSVRAGASIARVSTQAGGVTGVTLTDGSATEAGLLVLCCGTRPRTELAAAAGLAVAAGIVVDGLLRSVTDPAIYAIGDCAEHAGRVSGLVAQAWAHARTAARSVAELAAAGTQDERAHQEDGKTVPDVVRLKAPGIELAVLGSPRGGAGAEVVRFTDPARGVYQKLVVRDGRLAGAILLGDTRAAGTLTQLLDRGAALPAERWSMLAGGGAASAASAASVTESPVAIPGHATICQCNGVTKAAICAAWQRGARDAGQVAASTRAATGCGTCHPAVEGIVAWLAAAEPDTGPDTGPDTRPGTAPGTGPDLAAPRTPQLSAR
jgi:assimilatory nitrate reductase electron transfer subunit